MPTLRELQRAFAAGIHAGPEAELLQLVLPGGFAPERHFQVYRNNVYESLGGALKAVYPVVERLVGEGFFRYAAASFIPRHPPRGGNLHDFGGAFADFLAGFAPARDLPYLPDVARLEWAMHRAYHAADAAALDLAALAQVPPQDHARLHFHVHPSATLLASDFPIQHIWEANRPEHPDAATVRLDEGGVKLLVIRRTDVQWETLSDGDHAFLSGCLAGASFARAAEAAVRAQTDYDLTAALQRHVQLGTLTGFAVR